MKGIIAIAIILCLVGGYGMATGYNSPKSLPVAINGNEWNQQNRQDRIDSASRPDNRSSERADNRRFVRDY